MTARALTGSALAGLAGVTHGFFTRDGGVSQGVFRSLNCGRGSGDTAEAVAANRARAMAGLGLGPEALVTSYQVHGTVVRIVDGMEPAAPPPRADAAVTRAPGVALGVLTADCAPVLLAEPGAGVVAAAHAGWRGALAGVVDETVAAMAALGAVRARIVAAIGPCIARASYQVGPEFAGPFVARDDDAARFFTAPDTDGRPRFDLAGYLAWRLERLGVGGVEALGHDTYADAGAFFSYRRACHSGERDYGRLLSAIALTG